LTTLIIAWNVIFIIALGVSAQWFLGSHQRMLWLRAAHRNGPMLLAIRAQRLRGAVAIAQSTCGLVIGLLSFSHPPAVVVIVGLMLMAALTMILRIMEFYQRRHLEQVFGYKIKDPEEIPSILEVTSDTEKEP
jgi:hypothetical protein